MTKIKAQLEQIVLAFKEINPNAKKILFLSPFSLFHMQCLSSTPHFT